MDLASSESRALLGLMLTPGLGPTLVGRCVEAFGSAEATLDAQGSQLGGIRGISPRKAGELRRRIDTTLSGGAVGRELDAVAAADARLVHREDDDYPELLRHIPDPPLLLWVRGSMCGDDALALGVVGSRRCSHYGREQADRLAAQCAMNGLCVVSGGAYGVDIAAHRAVLRVGGRTTAVIGSGLGVPYPKDHVPVFEQIVAEGRGAVVSELPMATGPKPENFPRRNRIISGMSLGVLVVEAAKRSGALITARLCVEEHGRECMAVPGRVDTPAASGCHQIIRDGWATLVTSATDVMDQLGDAGRLLQRERAERQHHADTPPGPDTTTDASLFEVKLSGAQQKIVEALDGDGRSLDGLVAATGLPVGTLSAELTLLEVRGILQRRGGRFVRRGVPA
jgi:DNA processing protein